MNESAFQIGSETTNNSFMMRNNQILNQSNMSGQNNFINMNPPNLTKQQGATYVSANPNHIIPATTYTNNKSRSPRTNNNQKQSNNVVASKESSRIYSDPNLLQKTKAQSINSQKRPDISNVNVISEPKDGLFADPNSIPLPPPLLLNDKTGMVIAPPKLKDMDKSVLINPEKEVNSIQNPVNNSQNNI